MNFKVGVITFHTSSNYGAILQAFALQQFLRAIGAEGEIIDYAPPNRGSQSLPLWKKLRSRVWGLLGWPLGKRIRMKRTEEFRRKYLPLSLNRFTSPAEIRRNCPQYSAYITGSDQVWNFRNIDNDATFFLDFAPQSSRKLSYAASFGVVHIPPQYQEDYRKRLMMLDSISVREEEGCRLVRELSGRRAQLVLDPVFLPALECWTHVWKKPPFDRPYILCYYMPGDKVVASAITKIANLLRCQTGYSIVKLGQKEYMRLKFWEHCVCNAGPAEFLGWLKYATYIVTNSFHGTAFSILFQKPFWVPVREFGTSYQSTLNSRITTLLKTADLENRQLLIGADFDSISLVQEIDYQPVAKRLETAKEHSTSYLKESLLSEEERSQNENEE